MNELLLASSLLSSLLFILLIFNVCLNALKGTKEDMMENQEELHEKNNKEEKVIYYKMEKR